MKRENIRKIVYDVGVDIGTNSVGWAVVDENAKMLRFKAKNMWGVRLFDIAKTKAERRVFRSTRRRLDRRRQRVLNLQSLLAEDVLQVDESFFHRLDESALVPHDKQFSDKLLGLPARVFEGEQGKPAFKAYPTIYHLRKALCEHEEKADIRYVYLALHHIIKYRGNFLYEGQTISSIGSDVDRVMEDSLGIVLGQEYVASLPEGCLKEVSNTLQSPSITRKDKASAVMNALCAKGENKVPLDAWTKALLGMSFTWEKLTGVTVSTENQMKIELSRESAEDDLIAHDPENAELIYSMMQLYRWQMFSSLRRENESLSQSMVRKYDEHKSDLTVLKRLVRTHFPENGQELYKLLFKDERPKSPSYYNYCKQSGEITKDKFFTALKKELKAKAAELAENADYQHVMSRMGEQNEGEFLYLQRNKDNGSIPNQFHLEELAQILQKQAAHHPALRKYGDKILAICSFRIPYHVGPLNEVSPFAWVKRKEQGGIKPWNFKEKVDVALSAEWFMKNLTSNCTYLPSERVLPRFSPLYQEYCLLDELNKVRIIFRDGASRFISVKEKKKMLSELFLRYKKVNKKAAVKWLAAQGVIDIEDLSGLRKDEGEAFEGTLSTLIDFASIGVSTDNREIIEEIVVIIATFQDRSIILDKLSAFSSLTEQQVRFLSQRQYKGWGRLSAKLLDGILGVYRDEQHTIIEVMRESDLNFMQIVNDNRLLFNRRLEEENGGSKDDNRVTMEEIRALPCSPALHRSIWQTVKLLEEIEAALGSPPRAVYLEVTRDDDPRKKGKRTFSRIEMLEKTYRMNHLDGAIQRELAELKKQGKNIDDERLLLYYMQHCKCLYTGMPLDIHMLQNYHVDHIVPRSFKKDDSINNKALITSEANMAKGASLVVPESFRRTQYAQWNHLRQVGLMSENKFRNLNRSGYQAEELAGFLNRQLVETSQSIKHIITLLRAHKPQVKVQSVKARLTSDLREQYGWVKLRELNDYHHAFDALLSVTMGQFTSKYMSWLEDERQRERRVRYYRDNRPTGGGGMALGFFRTEITNPETGEIHNPGRSVSYLKAAFSYMDCFITRKADIETGIFYHQQLVAKSAVLNLFPRKKGLDPEKYGGYASPTTAYMAAIEFTNTQGKRERRLVNVPVLFAASIGDSIEKLKEYLQNGREAYRDVCVLCAKIPVNQLVLYDGHLIWLRSASEAWNARQLLLDKECFDLAVNILKGKGVQPDQIPVEEFMKRLRKKLRLLYPRYRGIADKFERAKNDWALVSASELRDILVQLFRVTAASGITGDFSKIPQLPELKANQGRMTNVNFDLDKLIFIDQSITGLFERREKRCYGLSNGSNPKTLQTQL